MSYKFIEETLKERYSHLDLSKNPWRELVNTVSYGAGWHDLIIELMVKIEELYNVHGESMEGFKIYDIKEKYGGLRVVFDKLSDNESLNIAINDLLVLYDEKSYTVCDECGESGVLRKNDSGWLQVLCVECAKEHGYKT